MLRVMAICNLQMFGTEHSLTTVLPVTYCNCVWSVFLFIEEQLQFYSKSRKY